MKKTILFIIMVLATIGLVSAVTINTGVEFWMTGYGGHINTTSPFETSLTELSTNQLNITSSEYQAINVKSVNNTVSSNVTFKGLGSFSQIFNGTSSTPEKENVDEYMMNISQMNRSIIISWPAADFPRFSSIDTTVETLIWSLTGTTPATGTLVIIYTGSGQVTLTNMGGHGLYDVFLNGVIVTNTASNIYTLSSPGTWTFTSHTESLSTMPQGQERSMFFILLFMIVFGAIYTLITNPSVGLIVIIIGASIALYIIRAMM
jgi:hypothetical protein